MGKELIIAEKPSVARDIAGVLGCKQKGNGYLEGPGYVVTWAIGHLITLCEPEDYDERFKKWQYATLPIIPETIKIKPYEKTESQLRIIDKLMKRDDVDSLICATDSGREGELIFRYIYDYAGCQKSFKRLWISSMTDEAISEGFRKLKAGTEYDNLYQSAKCRSEADWLVGINATRAYTTKNDVLLSIGRVQTPTLALVVMRQREIDHFVPKDYFEVEVGYGDFKGTWFDEKPSETRIDKEEKAKAIAEKVLNKTGIIKSITKKKNKQMPPPLYDLTELQRDGNRQHGFTAQQVLTIAQSLYEKRKMVTYPRTDSRYLSEDMKPVVKQTMDKLNVPPYNKAIAVIKEKGELKFSKRIIDNSKVTDHHAIIPTNVTPKIDSLTKDELSIYNLIVKRFLAVFYDDFLFDTTELIAEVEAETFVSKGKIITQKGWKALYVADKDDTEQELPNLKKGGELTVVETQLLKKQTSPPKPYTEATILSAMENAGRYIEDESLKEQLKESGFGTPATRAGIIERLIQVEYILRKGKSIYPTDKGIKLIEIIPDELKSAETTGKWEKALNKVNKGELESAKFMKSIQRFVVYLVQSAANQNKSVVFEKKEQKGQGEKRAFAPKGDLLGRCPSCKTGSIAENAKAFYCSRWQEGCSFKIWKEDRKRPEFEPVKRLVAALLETGKLTNYEVRMKNNETTRMDLEISDAGDFLWTESKGVENTP